MWEKRLTDSRHEVWWVVSRTWTGGLDMWPETEDRETRRSRLENATAWGSAQTEYSGTNFAITDRSIATPPSNGTLVE